MDDGTERLLKAGDYFCVPPGERQPRRRQRAYVSLRFLGTDAHAAPAE